MDSLLLEWLKDNEGRFFESPRKKAFGRKPKGFTITSIDQDRQWVKVTFEESQNPALALKFAIFDQPEGTYTNTATATGFDEGDHEVTDSDSATCRISTMVDGEIIEAVSKSTRRNIAMAAYALIGLVVYLLIRRLN